MTLKELLDKAGINNREFADIMDCSEIAVMKWKTGGGIHRLRQEKFDAVCIAVSECLYQNLLPLPKRERGEPPRTKKLKLILSKYLPKTIKI